MVNVFNFYTFVISNLHLLNQTWLIFVFRSGHEKAIKLLFEKGANINDKDIENESALHLAAGNGNSISTIFTIFALNEKVTNLFFCFIFLSGHVDAMKILFDHGANVDVKDEDNDTPLHLAANNGDFIEFYYSLPKILKTKKIIFVFLLFRSW